MLEMRDESFMCSNRGVGGKSMAPKVNDSSKVDGQSESERSFYGKWTVLQKLDGLLTKSGDYGSSLKWTVSTTKTGRS